MKLKNLFELIGLRSKPVHYLYKVDDFDLGDGTTVRYAQWLHPGESKKVISADHIDQYRQIVNEGDFCIDIGAHTGDSTLPMAIAVGPTGMVLALEPNPFVYHVLEKNARANSHVANIKTMMAAVYTHESFVEFEYSDSGFCNGGRHENISALRHGHAFKQEVFCVDLEKELTTDFAEYLDRLRLIKIDSEGYDLYILRQLKNIIEKYRPVIKTEIFKKTDRQYRLDVLSFFKELNYSVWFIDREPITKGELLTEDNLLERRHYDILCEPE